MEQNTAMNRKHNEFTKKLYTFGEEIFNSVSHGLGALLASAGLALMIVKSLGNGVKLTSTIIYGITLLILYMASTLYHAIANPTAKRVLRSFDHCSIFLLIAGTYTPISLIAMHGKVGYTLCAVVWSCALLGIVLNCISIERFKILSMVLYVAMGWAVVFAFRPLVSAVEQGFIWLLVSGGLAYTLGIIFYAMKKVRYMHSVWHLFVLAGSVLHYVAIIIYLL